MIYSNSSSIRREETFEWKEEYREDGNRVLFRLNPPPADERIFNGSAPSSPCNETTRREEQNTQMNVIKKCMAIGVVRGLVN